MNVDSGGDCDSQSQTSFVFFVLVIEGSQGNSPFEIMYLKANLPDLLLRAMGRLRETVFYWCCLFSTKNRTCKCSIISKAKLTQKKLREKSQLLINFFPDLVCTYAYMTCQLPERIQGGSIQLSGLISQAGSTNSDDISMVTVDRHLYAPSTPREGMSDARTEMWLLTLLMCILWILNKGLGVVELPAPLCQLPAVRDHAEGKAHPFHIIK